MRINSQEKNMILKIGYNINGQKFSDNKYGQNLQSKPTVAPPPEIPT